MTTIAEAIREIDENLQERTLARIVGYRDRRQQYARFNSLQDELRALAPIYADQYNQTLGQFEAALGGDASASEVVDAYFAFADARRVSSDFNELTGRVKQEISDGINPDLRETYEDDAVSPALEYLDEQLQRLMTLVCELDDELGSIDTAEAALRAGGDRAAAWLTLGEAITSYQRIREIQRHTLHRYAHDDGRKGPQGVFRTDSYVRDAFGYEPYYLDRRRWPTHREKPDERVRPFIAWRNEPVAADWRREARAIWPDSDRHEHLRALARSGQAWVPTIPEMERSRKLAEEMFHPHFLAAMEAFDGYYSGRGVEPRGAAPDTAEIRAAYEGAKFVTESRKMLS